MGRKPSAAQDKFIVRLPDGMRDQLKAAAEGNGRSMTSEVVERLRASFEKEEAQDVPDFTAAVLVETVEQEFETLRDKISALEEAQSMLVQELRRHFAKKPG
jgi:plasmid stability protein